jgi:hypothetical protein
MQLHGRFVGIRWLHHIPQRLYTSHTDVVIYEINIIFSHWTEKQSRIALHYHRSHHARAYINKRQIIFRLLYVRCRTGVTEARGSAKTPYRLETLAKSTTSWNVHKYKYFPNVFITSLHISFALMSTYCKNKHTVSQDQSHYTHHNTVMIYSYIAGAWEKGYSLKSWGNKKYQEVLTNTILFIF